MEEIKVFLVKKLSKNEKEYFNLYVDYGFRKQSITMDSALICSLCDVTQLFLHNDLVLDEPIQVCSILPVME